MRLTSNEPATASVVVSARRRRPIVSTAAFLLLACAVLARAELQFDVFLGFAENVPEASWFPATIEVMNDGPPFHGVIEVTAGFGRSGSRELVPVELPTRTLKRVSLPLFNGAGGYGAWNFRLLDARGRPIATRPNLRARRDVPRESRIIAAVVQVQSGLPVLPGVGANQRDGTPVVARLQPDQLPDNALALEGLGALYLGSERAPDLKAPQVSALLAWVHGGGRLIIGVDQPGDVAATPWLRDLLPCTLGGTAEVKPGDVFHRWLPNENIAPAAVAPASATNAVTNLTGSATTKRRRTPPRPGDPPIPLPSITPDPMFAGSTLPVIRAKVREGTALLTAGNVPLVIEGRRGRGSVVVLAFSAEREPFRSWKHRDWFWMKLAAVPEEIWTRAQFNRSYGTSLDAVFGTVLDSRQAGKMPIGWLLLLLAGYILVIGPGDRWTLRKLNRPMLTWITFPLYVAGFSVLVYLIGYALRAGETEWNELHLVDVLPRTTDTAQLRGRTFASLYSSGNRAYELRSEAGAFGAFRGEFATTGASAEPGRVVREANEFTAHVSVPVWTSQLFVHEWSKSTRTPIVWRVRPVGNGHEVEVENRVDRPLKDLTLVLGNQVHVLGEVAANTKKTFNAGSGRTIDSHSDTFRQTIYRAVQFRQSPFGRDNRPVVSPIEAAFVTTFRPATLSNTGGVPVHFRAQGGLDLTDLAARGDAVLLARTDDHSPAAPMRRFNARQSLRATVYRLVTTPAEP